MTCTSSDLMELRSYDLSRYGADDDLATLEGLDRGDYTIYINSPFGDVTDIPYVLQANVTPNAGP
jgi:hypothetical protein